ncbi:hypothetical protein DM02DRAFT_111585 [Periconia macrospinosa]|uniref:Uncharacterized protein n=1 Tax=Periconia macrospinosa TaxID=97972 RepID=A0A2V1E3W7_9PLEO|nr:hypothetical protein DM02DRAFT_111585 [Periconia macrospinosa]
MMDRSPPSPSPSIVWLHYPLGSGRRVAVGQGFDYAAKVPPTAVGLPMYAMRPTINELNSKHRAKGKNDDCSLLQLPLRLHTATNVSTPVDSGFMDNSARSVPSLVPSLDPRRLRCWVPVHSEAAPRGCPPCPPPSTNHSFTASSSAANNKATRSLHTYSLPMFVDSISYCASSIAAVCDF